MAEIFDFDDPVLVLLSDEMPGGTGAWRSIKQSFGGFACYEFEGYAYQLPVDPRAQHIVAGIGNEDFCGAHALDYRADEQTRIAYREYLAHHGLEISDGTLSTLTQAIYPIDPSQKNLEKLTGLSRLPVEWREGMLFAVLGWNCD